jgi:hypothetical protein
VVILKHSRLKIVSAHPHCQGCSHLTRRSHLRGASTAGISWLTPLADILAAEAEKAPKGKPAKSLILLWLGGAASQLDTFDPHPTTKIGGGVKSIDTAIKGVQFAAGLEQTASVMGDVSLIRSMVSKEGDHERAFYNIKTGYRPDPTLIHPSIGAVTCHELPEATHRDSDACFHPAESMAGTRRLLRGAV